MVEGSLPRNSICCSQGGATFTPVKDGLLSYARCRRALCGSRVSHVCGSVCTCLLLSWRWTHSCVHALCSIVRSKSTLDCAIID